MMWGTNTHKEVEKKGSVTPRVFRRVLLVLVPVLGLIGLVVYVTFSLSSEAPQDVLQHKEIGQFDQRLKEVCGASKLPILEYKGVESFFNYILEPDVKHCHSWVEFGGEKIVIPSQSQKECMDEIRKSKYICFNREYQMNKDPCLVYSFGRDADSQFERDMHMFSCNVHTFDHLKVKEGEHVQRTDFWFEHAWDISEYPYDLPSDGATVMRRSLEFIVKSLNHRGHVIKYLKSDLEGREWILLREIITHQDIVDIQQIGLQLHIPTKINNMTGTDRHDYLRGLFQVFQGLHCAGYKYIQGRPIEYYTGRIKVPEVKQVFFTAYEVNFAKVLPS